MGNAVEHELSSINTLLAVFVIASSIFASYLIKKYKCFGVPESAITMLVGVAIGGVARLSTSDEGELNELQFKPEIFFFILLPPIIFEAGYSLKRVSLLFVCHPAFATFSHPASQRRFFQNLSTILLFAVIGTIVSTFLVGSVIYGFSAAGVIPLDSSSPLQSFLFGALISAVDPVATLSIMGHPELQCDPLLYSLVFGESVLNDAVAIVLFKTFENLTERDHVDLNQAGSYFLLILEFVGIALGSIVVGIVMGLLACLICKHTHLKKYPSKEITVLFLFAYGSYALGELIDLSGIMALFFTGIVLSHYNFHNLSTITQESSTYTFKAFSHSTETVVFAYMGLSLFTSRFSSWSGWMIVIAILACLLGRALNTFPLSWLANKKRKKKIPPAMQFVIWFAGLRGAIAFALSLNMPSFGGKWDETNEFVVTTTLGIVMFTTFVCGGLTAPILDKFGMKTADVDEEDDEGELMDYRALYQNKTPVATPTNEAIASPPLGAAPSGLHKAGGLHRWWKVIDNKYVKPLFGGKPKAKYLSVPTGAAERTGLMGSRSNSGYVATSASSAPFATLAADSSAVGGGYGSGDNHPAATAQVEYSDSDSDGGDLGAGSGDFFGASKSQGASGGGYKPPPGGV